MFNLRDYNPYELSKINVNKIQLNTVPSNDEYNNIMSIINNDLSQEQYKQLYIMFIMNLSETKYSKTARGIMIDLKQLSLDEFYRLENIICEFIFELNKTDTPQKQEEQIELKPNCDYSSINNDLYVDESIEINTQQPNISNYLELYDIQRSLPSLKK